MDSRTLEISRAGFWIRYCRVSLIITLSNWRAYSHMENHHKSKTMRSPENTGSNTYNGEVTDEGDCGDGSGCQNGRGEAGGAARAAGGDKRRCCSDSCVGIHRG